MDSLVGLCFNALCVCVQFALVFEVLTYVNPLFAVCGQIFRMFLGNKWIIVFTTIDGITQNE